MLNLRITVLLLLMVIYLSDAKVFEKCELARELRYRHAIPFERIGIITCIAQHQSNFNTAAFGGGSYYGMFQVSGDYWCEQNYAGKGCVVRCASLLDDDITDDLSCLQIIYDEHQRLFNNGFNAWPSSQYCQSQGNYFVQECFDEDNQIIKAPEPVLRREKITGNVDEGKVYERCELARELHYQHKVSPDQIATWVCIAKHESAFNTSAIGRLNWDGSEDHGLFQISDIYWCGETGKSCGVRCEALRNNDITDDVKCMQQIHAEHQRLSGDGFTAWAVYPRCKGQSDSFVEGCFGPSYTEVMPYKPKPGVQQPTKVYAAAKRKETEKPKPKGKVYERCELAQELRFKHKIPLEQIATWVCIAKHESNFDTSAIGRLNLDGSEDHGLFQISDIYWCNPPDTGNACGIACSKLEDSDITDDVACMAKIYDEHQLISGNGFNAWTVYRPHCQGRDQSYIDGCFEQTKPRPAVTQPQTTSRPVTTTKRVITTTYRPPTTSRVITTTTSRPATTTYRLPATTTTTPTKRFYDTKPLIDTTIRNSKTTKNWQTWQTTQQISKTSPAKTSFAKTAIKSATTTQRSVSTFDLYFNNVGRRPNDINPPQKRVTFKQTSTTKAPITSSRILNEVKLSNGQPKTTRRTAWVNPYSTSTAFKSAPVVTAGKTTLTNAKTFTQEQKNILQSSRGPTQTKRTPATQKPFNLFDFYLTDYTSKAPIRYQPVQFSDKSTVIIKKADTSNRPASSTAAKPVTTTTTRRQEIRREPATAPLSIYNANEDYSVKSNRIGRLAPNVTPHSFDYLLKLTTPRSAFKRS